MPGCMLGTGALNAAWALLQKLLSMNSSNLLTAAFNYSADAELHGLRQRAVKHGGGGRRKLSMTRQHEDDTLGGPDQKNLMSHDGFKSFSQTKIASLLR